MSHELVIAMLAGLGGMFGWGLADFFAKKTIDEIGDIPSLVWAHVFGTIAMLAVVLYRFFIYEKEVFFPTSLSVWGLLVFFGILQAAVYLFVYRGFSKGRVAILNPIFASFSGLVALFSIMFLGEQSSGTIIVLLIGMFVGVILLSTDIKVLSTNRSGFVHEPGSKDILVATILATFWTILWDRFVGGQDWASYALFMYVFMTIALLIFSKFTNTNLLLVKQNIWKYLVFIGIFEIIAYLSISLGYSVTTRTSIVAMLSGAFSLPTIILAYIYLKERMNKNQIFGGFLVVLGIVLLSLL